ncbi:MAG: FAD-dependent oxidoreductase, partial [Proteobacteria bacterium]|nr:FAD-dependent oxidoreductase [Pseudomonadota bacterium]
MNLDQQQHDVLIIGSGAAGLSLALKLADHAKIAVLSKDALIEGATFYAQGGVSAVLDEHDSIASHVEDTLLTGAGLCNADIVRYVVEQAHKSVDWLVEQGVNFTLLNDASGSGPNPRYHLHQEGGHSHR